MACWPLAAPPCLVLSQYDVQKLATEVCQKAVRKLVEGLEARKVKHQHIFTATVAAVQVRCWRRCPRPRPERHGAPIPLPGALHVAFRGAWCAAAAARPAAQGKFDQLMRRRRHLGQVDVDRASRTLKLKVRGPSRLRSGLRAGPRLWLCAQTRRSRGMNEPARRSR